MKEVEQQEEYKSRGRLVPYHTIQKVLARGCSESN